MCEKDLVSKILFAHVFVELKIKWRVDLWRSQVPHPTLYKSWLPESMPPSLRLRASPRHWRGGHIKPSLGCCSCLPYLLTISFSLKLVGIESMGAASAFLLRSKNLLLQLDVRSGGSFKTINHFIMVCLLIFVRLRKKNSSSSSDVCEKG
jgi:hypothetical protein